MVEGVVLGYLRYTRVARQIDVVILCTYDVTTIAKCVWLFYGFTALCYALVLFSHGLIESLSPSALSQHQVSSLSLSLFPVLLPVPIFSFWVLAKH